MRKFITPLLIMSVVMLTGCGGGGSDSGDVESTFEGIWAGTWTSPSIPANGTASIIVQSDGTFTGTSNIQGGASGGSITGSINNDGLVTGSVQYSGQAASGISGTLGTVDGTTLTGTLVQTLGSGNHNVTYNLTLQ